MFKVILCGETEVGKTTILNRLANRSDVTATTPTMGASFASIQVMSHDQELKLNIWDTAGQEKYRSLIKIYFRAADLAVFVVDLTRKKTVDEIPVWVRQAEANTGKTAPTGLIVANKMDCEDMELVSDEEIGRIADQYGFKWVKVSASTGANFGDLQALLAEECLRHGSKIKAARQSAEGADETHPNDATNEEAGHVHDREEEVGVPVNVEQPSPRGRSCC